MVGRYAFGVYNLLIVIFGLQYYHSKWICISAYSFILITFHDSASIKIRTFGDRVGEGAFRDRVGEGASILYLLVSFKWMAMYTV